MFTQQFSPPQSILCTSLLIIFGFHISVYSVSLYDHCNMIITRMSCIATFKTTFFQQGIIDAQKLLCGQCPHPIAFYTAFICSPSLEIQQMIFFRTTFVSSTYDNMKFLVGELTESLAVLGMCVWIFLEN